MTTEDLIKFLEKYPGYNVRIYSNPQEAEIEINEKIDIDVDMKDEKIIFDGQYQTSESRNRKIEVYIVSGVEGPSVYINNYRICGNKPWGGGKVIHKFSTGIKEINIALNTKESKTINVDIKKKGKYNEGKRISKYRK